MSKEYTFTELVSMLAHLEVGTFFVTDYGSVLRVGFQENPTSTSNKTLYWVNSSDPVALCEILTTTTFKEYPKFVPLPIEVALKKLFQESSNNIYLIDDAGFTCVTIWDSLDDYDINTIEDLASVTFYEKAT